MLASEDTADRRFAGPLSASRSIGELLLDNFYIRFSMGLVGYNTVDLVLSSHMLPKVL